MSAASIPFSHRPDPPPSLREVQTWLGLLFGGIDHKIEVRAPKCRVVNRPKNVVSRFGTGKIEAVAGEVLELSGNAPAVYVVMNGVSPAMPLGRDLHPGAAAADIPRRLRILVDVDPVRFGKDGKKMVGDEGMVNSTAAEKAAASEVALAIRDFLVDLGWPEPIIADSGNGYHLLFFVDLPADDVFAVGKDGKPTRADGPSTDLVKRVLEGLAGRFDTPAVEVDRRVFDLPRLVKCYGTWACKGDDTPERPGRYARVLSVPAELIPVPVELMEAVAAKAPGDVLGGFDLADDIEQKRGQSPPESTGKAPAANITKDRKAILDSFSDEELLTWARHAMNGKKFSALYDDGALTGRQSPSEADCALLVMLAYWTGDDAARMERLFDGSALARRGKWRERQDYRALTIASAIELNGGKCPDLTETVLEHDGDYDRLIVQIRPKAPPSSPRWKPAEVGAAEANGEVRSKGASLDEHLSKRPRTDLGNAERLVGRHGRDLRYCHPWKRWLVWDGRRWKDDDTGGARRHARNTVRAILGEAKTIGDDDRRKEHALWALTSEKRDKIGAMLHLAEAEVGIPILPKDVDADPWLFNCRNGTIDLRTGELRPHRREDLITKICDLEYDLGAPCPLWLGTLAKFFARPDPERQAGLIDYWRRLCGYALTGVVRDHLMPIAYGKGSNGKSTILGTLMDVFGSDYAMKCPPDMLMAKKTDSHPTDRADLFGKRLVVALETEGGRRLNETMVKELTGGDPIRARRMREDFWEFKPTHTLMMATNHKPVIRGTDTGIWRRLKLVPFTVRIDDKDALKDMPERLQAEWTGILAWCVEGCREWQERGLDSPKEVVEATKGYRAEQDVVGLFLDECTVQGPNLKAKASPLYERYKAWAEKCNEHAMSMKLFCEAIQEREFEKKVSNGNWYLGLGLVQENEADNRERGAF